MGESRDLLTLDWVQTDIEQTLGQAEESVKAFLAEQDNDSHLQACYDAVHQVHGSLQMAGLQSALLLTEQTESLISGMINNSVPRSDESLAALAQALVNIPPYLSRVKEESDETPLLLLPTINDLRKAMGEDKLPELSLFNPDLGLQRPEASDEAKATFSNEDDAVLRKLRQAYQHAMVGLLRGDDARANTARISHVTVRLEQICKGTRMGQVWEVMAAVMEGVLNGSIEMDSAGLELLRSADKLLKRLIAAGVDALDDQPPEPLMKGLLYSVAKANVASPHIQRVKNDYQLERYQLDGNVNGSALRAGPDKDTLVSLAAALTEELQRIKDTVDLYVRSEAKGNVDLGGLMPSLKQISSTLVLLNLEAPRVLLQEQLDVLTAHSSDQGAIADDTLLQIAEALLYVEAELNTLVDSISAPNEDAIGALAGAAHETVVKESLASLKSAKDALNEFVTQADDFAQLETVPLLLRGVYGGLSMLSLSLPAQLVLSCAHYAEDDIIALSRVPEGDALDSLAQVMASVELYLEALAAGRSGNAQWLEDAKSHMASLGYPLDQTDGINSEDDSDDMLASAEPFELPEIKDEAAFAAEASVEEVSLDDSAIDAVALEMADPNGSVDEIIADESIIEWTVDEAATEEAVEPIDAGLDEPVTGVEVDSVEEPAELEDDEDNEILEIFAEEAEEVFAAISEQWPQFAADYSQQDALSESRRAFHTLKGSGRMVGAELIGELAWAVESLLNQVVDGVIPMTPDIDLLVGDVNELLPQLLEHFKQGTSPSEDIASLQQRAQCLADGQEAPEQVKEALQPEEQQTLEELQPTEEPQLSEEPTLRDIFAGEVGLHLETIDGFVQEALALNETESEAPALPDTLYRALHTIAGSAHMAEYVQVGKIAGVAEKMLNTLRDHNRVADEPLLNILSRISDFTKAEIAAGDDSESQSEMGQVLFEDVTALHSSLLAELDAADSQANTGPDLSVFLQENIDLVCGIGDQFDQLAATGEADSEQISGIFRNVDLLREASESVGLEQVRGLLGAMSRAYGSLQSGACGLESQLVAVLRQSHEALVGVMDQLAASQDVVSVAEVGELLDETLSQTLQAAIEPEESIELDIVDAEIAVEQATSESETTEFEIAEPEAIVDTPEEQSSAVETSSETAPDAPPIPAMQQNEMDPEMLEIFLEEASDIMDAVSGANQRWVENAADVAALDELQRGLHTLKGGARMAGAAAIGDLAHEMENIYQQLVAGQAQASSGLFELMHACDDRLSDMLSEMSAGRLCQPAGDLVARLQAAYRGELPTAPSVLEEPVAEGKVAFDTGLGATVEADPAQVAGFFDNARGILEQVHQRLIHLAASAEPSEAERNDIQALVIQLRDHAIEAGVNEIGDLSQFFAEVIATTEITAFADLQVQADVVDWVERIVTSLNEASGSMASAMANGMVGGVATGIVTANNDQAAPASKASTSQETVRVSSALLEQIVDLAGETSVSRARVEQQVSKSGYAIDEMGSTVERLREQLRRMDIETEAQILFRQERDGPAHEGFDPLEMDRYTRMQELSRSLMESVSDLFDLKGTLQDNARDTDGLLLQQARINTELQESLMKTRMVPFSRLAPRLQRIVRQVSRELGKEVDFEIKNADAELDRSLLEHMIAPLEHMLRNAVDHGIESTTDRAATGKSGVGKVTLRLSRDGGDIVFDLGDDGKGINIDSVRKKAAERGLMAEDAKLSDHEVLQFILEAGFSTAEQVTQISGRGVGMDVVGSEIKQLGGTISIESEPGQGTRFIVRAPFTVSVNRALMVNVGDNAYSIPLNTIEGVVRVSPYELEEYYKEGGEDFHYAGRDYNLRYLGEFLGGQNTQLQGHSELLPVLLVRSPEHPTAIQVDSISGSREIVVKPLGPQLGALAGMSGATILGDGEVVLILDLPGMVRTGIALQGSDADLSEPVSVEPERSDENPVVMVVDDSVTVRKVASRMLERQGMEVVQAKDGVEAATKLQSRVPDIILLDIEMPRMDGFELASLVRHDDKLKNVPIVMITSRTGDKHKERAEALGVNRFMGKPFQEHDLLAAITELTDVSLVEQQS